MAASRSFVGERTAFVLLECPRVNEGSRFLFERTTDAESGLEVITLESEPGASAGERLRARVAPSMGANLFSLQIGDDELLAQPHSLRELATSSWGTPV